MLDVPGCSDEHAVAEALVGRRIAGGPIHNADIAVERVTPPDGSAFSKMRRGYALTRATRPEAAVIATGAIDDLKSLAAKLYPAEHEPGSGWFVPVAVGHRLLEDPEKVPRRANTRDPTIQHVFVEPAVGIAELVSVRNRRLTGLREPDCAIFSGAGKPRATGSSGIQTITPATTPFRRKRASMAKLTKNGMTKQLETGMLSFARSLQPSEGLFWGTRSSDAGWRQPIEVFEKGVRGQSSEFKTDNPGKSNPQVVEAAVVPPGCDGVRLEFSMLVDSQQETLGLRGSRSDCLVRKTR